MKILSLFFILLLLNFNVILANENFKIKVLEGNNLSVSCSKSCNGDSGQSIFFYIDNKGFSSSCDKGATIFFDLAKRGVRSGIYNVEFIEWTYHNTDWDNHCYSHKINISLAKQGIVE